MAFVDKINVLYIDDDKQLLEVIKDLLEVDEEISVDIYDDIEKAIEAIGANPYDIIISDYQMPKTDGIELLKTLRSMEKEIPFILFTGKGREEIAIEALNNGAYSYLQKGPDVKVVLAELRHRIKEGYRKVKAIKSTIASERRAWALLNLMDGPCMLIDRSYAIIATNEKLPELFDLEGFDAIGHSLIEITPKKHREEVEMVLDEVRSSKLATTLTYSVNERYLKMNLSPILDEAGDMDIIAVLSYDITDRIEKEIELNRMLGMEKNDLVGIIDAPVTEDGRFRG
jgi:PAS domain S-box-containing protein